MENQDRQVEILAKQLRDTGIACSVAEASSKAKEMIMQTSSKKQESQVPSDNNMQILEQRYKFMLESVSRKFNSQISTLQDSLSGVTTELNNLRKKFNSLNSSLAAVKNNQNNGEIRIEPEKKEELKNNVSENSSEESNNQIKPQPQNENKSASSNKMHGDLNPDDFSVQKYFYCGEK